MSTQPRKPAGSPNATGGQYDSSHDTETGLPSLEDPQMMLGPDARNLDIDLPDGTTIHAMALDGERVDRETIPDGWHVYSFMETESGDPTGTVESIRRDTSVNHRLDFITHTDLDPLIDAGELDGIDMDHWGFTD